MLAFARVFPGDAVIGPASVDKQCLKGLHLADFGVEANSFEGANDALEKAAFVNGKPSLRDDGCGFFDLRDVYCLHCHLMVSHNGCGVVVVLADEGHHIIWSVNDWLFNHEVTSGLVHGVHLNVVRS